jgi:hypothetical protein
MRTYILRLDEFGFNLLMYVMTIDFDVLYAFMKYLIGRNMHNSLIVTKQCHRSNVMKSKISKKLFELYQFASSRGQSTILCFSTWASYNILFLASPGHQIATYKHTIASGRSTIERISYSVKISVSRDVIMTIANHNYTTTNGAFQISQDIFDHT